MAYSANAAAARAPPLTEDCRVLVGPGPALHDSDHADADLTRSLLYVGSPSAPLSLDI